MFTFGFLLGRLTSQVAQAGQCPKKSWIQAEQVLDFSSLQDLRAPMTQNVSPPPWPVPTILDSTYDSKTGLKCRLNKRRNPIINCDGCHHWVRQTDQAPSRRYSHLALWPMFKSYRLIVADSLTSRMVLWPMFRQTAKFPDRCC